MGEWRHFMIFAVGLQILITFIFLLDLLSNPNRYERKMIVIKHTLTRAKKWHTVTKRQIIFTHQFSRQMNNTENTL